jgi:hypothetical protein
MATGMSFQAWHEISLPSFHLFLKCHSLCSFISLNNENCLGTGFAQSIFDYVKKNIFTA